MFYLSKLYDLGDTLLILLAMCYLWLATRQSLMPIALLTNAVAASISACFFPDSHDLYECHASSPSRVLVHLHMLVVAVCSRPGQRCSA